MANGGASERDTGGRADAQHGFLLKTILVDVDHLVDCLVVFDFVAMHDVEHIGVLLLQLAGWVAEENHNALLGRPRHPTVAGVVALSRMEGIRCAASVAMGIAPDLESARAITSVPKVAMVAAPQPATTLSGRQLGAPSPFSPRVSCRGSPPSVGTSQIAPR